MDCIKSMMVVCLVATGLYAQDSPEPICSTNDTSTIRSAVDKMCLTLASVNYTKDAQLEGYLWNSRMWQAGLFQKTSLKLYNDDKEFLDDVVRPSLIRKAESGQALKYSTFTHDTLFNTFLSGRSTDSYIIYYYCRSGHLKNSTPVYVFAAQICSKETFPVYGADEVRKIYSQRREQTERELEQYLEPFMKILNDGKTNFETGNYVPALKSFEHFRLLLDSIYWGRAAIRDKAHSVMAEDTINFGAKIKECHSKFRGSHPSDLIKIDSLASLIKAIENKVAGTNNKLLVISGDVHDFENGVCQVWGTALPLKTFMVKFGSSMTGLAGLAGLALLAAAAEMPEPDAESIPGVIAEEANIRLQGYDPESKMWGNMVIGQKVAVAGCVYKSRAVGTNMYGATVPIFNYVISPEQTKANALRKKQKMVASQRDSILKVINLSEDDYLLIK